VERRRGGTSFFSPLAPNLPRARGHGTHAGCSPRGGGHCARTAEARRLLRPATPRGLPSSPRRLPSHHNNGAAALTHRPRGTRAGRPENAVQAYTQTPTMREPERVVEQRETGAPLGAPARGHPSVAAEATAGTVAIDAALTRRHRRPVRSARSSGETSTRCLELITARSRAFGSPRRSTLAPGTGQSTHEAYPR
jgi:hypothetical protein